MTRPRLLCSAAPRPVTGRPGRGARVSLAARTARGCLAPGQAREGTHRVPGPAGPSRWGFPVPGQQRTPAPRAWPEPGRARGGLLFLPAEGAGQDGLNAREGAIGTWPPQAMSDRPAPWRVGRDGRRDDQRLSPRAAAGSDRGAEQWSSDAGRPACRREAERRVKLGTTVSGALPTSSRLDDSLSTCRMPC